MFLSKKMPFWCLPFVLQPSRKFDKEFWGIHVSIHSSDVSWVSTVSRSERLDMRVGSSFWTFMRNRPPQLPLPRHKWAHPPYSSQPPLSPPPCLSGSLRRGNEGWILRSEVDVQPASPSVVICMKDQAGTALCRVTEQEGPRRELSGALGSEVGKTDLGATPSFSYRIMIWAWDLPT